VCSVRSNIQEAKGCRTAPPDAYRGETVCVPSVPAPILPEIQPKEAHACTHELYVMPDNRNLIYERFVTSDYTYLYT